MPLGFDIIPVAFTDVVGMGGKICIGQFSILLNVSQIILNLFWDPNGDLLLLCGEGDLTFPDGIESDVGEIELWRALGGDLLNT